MIDSFCDNLYQSAKKDFNCIAHRQQRHVNKTDQDNKIVPSNNGNNRKGVLKTSNLEGPEKWVKCKIKYKIKIVPSGIN